MVIIYAEDFGISKFQKEDIKKKRLAILLSLAMIFTFEPTARDIFEEYYDQFMQVNGDQESREYIRAQILSDYVKANGLAVTKYQDEGWDPVDL